jgi:hypothetical protein
MIQVTAGISEPSNQNLQLSSFHSVQVPSLSSVHDTRGCRIFPRYPGLSGKFNSYTKDANIFLTSVKCFIFKFSFVKSRLKFCTFVTICCLFEL